MGVVEAREEWALAQMGDREMSISELYEESPVRVCPGWERHQLGVQDPTTGLWGHRAFSWTTLHHTLERLRLQGRVDRRKERGRGESRSGHAVWVYFKTPGELSGTIAELEKALASGSG